MSHIIVLDNVSHYHQKALYLLYVSVASISTEIKYARGNGKSGFISANN
jgi:hypothetical protein